MPIARYVAFEAVQHSLKFRCSGSFPPVHTTLPDNNDPDKDFVDVAVAQVNTNNGGSRRITGDAWLASVRQLAGTFGGKRDPAKDSLERVRHRLGCLEVYSHLRRACD